MLRTIKDALLLLMRVAWSSSPQWGSWSHWQVDYMRVPNSQGPKSSNLTCEKALDQFAPYPLWEELSGVLVPIT